MRGERDLGLTVTRRSPISKSSNSVANDGDNEEAMPWIEESSVCA